MAAKVKRCARCDRRVRSGTDWTVAIDDVDDRGYGVVTEIYCPKCTTDAERTQCDVNDATVRYVWNATGDRVARYPKLETVS